MIIPTPPDSFNFLGFAIKYYSVLVLIAMILGISFMCIMGKYFYKNVKINTLLDNCLTKLDNSNTPIIILIDELVELIFNNDALSKITSILKCFFIFMKRK